MSTWDDFKQELQVNGIVLAIIGFGGELIMRFWCKLWGEDV